MSFAVSTLVKSARLPPLRCKVNTAKSILLVLADCADDDGANAWPSVATIGDQMGLSRRTVQGVLGQLVAAGVLEVQAKATQHRPTIYRLNVVALRGVTVEVRGATGAPLEPARGATTAPLEPARGATAAPLSPAVVPARGATVAPDPIRTERTKDPEGARPQGPDRTKDGGTELVRALERLPVRIAAALEGRKSTPGAPLHTSHKSHAHCGRVCLHATLFDEFKRRRGHLDADREIRDWALEVERQWEQFDGEPGNPFDFWRARYAERWPTSPQADAPRRLTGAAKTFAIAEQIIRDELTREGGGRHGRKKT